MGVVKWVQVLVVFVALVAGECWGTEFTQATWKAQWTRSRFAIEQEPANYKLSAEFVNTVLLDYGLAHFLNILSMATSMWWWQSWLVAEELYGPWNLKFYYLSLDRNICQLLLQRDKNPVFNLSVCLSVCLSIYNSTNTPQKEGKFILLLSLSHMCKT